MKRRTLIVIVIVCLPAVIGMDPASPAKSLAPSDHRLLIVWGPQSITRKVEVALDRMDGVRATSTLLGLGWLTSSRDADGRILDDPGRGYAYPIEAAVIKPDEYERFSVEADRELVRGLRRGEALLSEAGAALRRRRHATRIRLSGQRLKIKGIVSNRTAQGHEILVPAPTPRPWARTIRSVIVKAEDSVGKDEIRKRVDRVLDSDFRIKSEVETRYMRYAVSVKPFVAFKKNFGEFAARPSSEGSIDLKPGWTDRHISTQRVPILGNVTCHNELFPQLRGALRELKRKGKSHVVRREEYAGCFNARFIATAPGTRISRHTWGVALDINTSNNQFGQKPHQPRELVKTMRKWGFLWGGYWMTPDGMHFEWKRWPQKLRE